MAPSPQHSAGQLSQKSSLSPTADPRFTSYASRFTLRPIGILLALFCFIFAACGTTGQTGKIIHDDPRGTVSLQTISDQSIHANHPINLDPTLVAQVLSGMAVQDQERGLQRLFGGAPAPIPVFSDDEIQFLAPLLAEGLRKAAPNERIEYLVQTTHEGSLLESSIVETTAGSLYAYGRSLYMTLSQYRYAPARVNLHANDGAYRMNRPDASGLQSRILLFSPSSAQRSDAYNPQGGGKSTDRFIAVDYQLLQQAPPEAVTTGQSAPRTGTSPIPGSPVGTSPSEAQARSTEALAQEVEALRKELQSVQQQLGNQPAKQDSQKKKTTPKQK
jgi:hypothetical protein